MNTKTEYQVEYCGGRKPGGSSTVAPVQTCSKSLDVQPVGGRNQARNKAMATGLPVYDEDYVATVYSQAERGTHRVHPRWHDPNLNGPVRAGYSTLYEPADRDPANRNTFYLYRSTLVDPLQTPAKPLPVPDVHKLRYMSNTYMSPDDWY